MEFAKHLTLVEMDLYAAISPKECLNLAWSKKKDEAPNVLGIIEQFNRVRIGASFLFQFMSQFLLNVFTDLSSILK